MIFNTIAILLIVSIITWFFFMKGKSLQTESEEITILVKEGVYSPNRIQTSLTQLTLNFIREDPSPCSEYVLFEQLQIHEQLPLNQSHKITLSQLKPGHYRFTCQMGMYQGELIIEEKK